MTCARTAARLASGAFGVVSLALLPAGAHAGGFEIREQSAFFSGTAYAGTAAGGASLSSIFWNPAASAYVGDGITSDSSYTLVLPRADLHVDSVFPDNGGDRDVDIARDAIIPASYYAWRYNAKTVLAVSVSAPFGLTTKPDTIDWAGAHLAKTSKMATINVSPSVSYQLMPGVAVGVGLQIQHMDLKALNTSLYEAELDDIGVGAQAGINITPFRGTSIGLGYRSRIRHDLDGKFDGLGTPGLVSGDISTTLEVPDKVTLSFRQDVSAKARLLGTVEWTNWSAMDDSQVPLPGGVGTGALRFGWEDGWFYSVGGEYDWSPKLTLRGGVAFEKSPIQDATARLIQVPDSDRVWFGLGASYKYSESTTFHLSYLHVELDEERFARESLLGPALGTITGSTDVSADAVSVGATMKLGNFEDLFRW
jgi:long-chain fatty acid transport protein